MKREKISTHQVTQIIDKKGKPEVHLHMALTFVWGGDPSAILPEDRNQQEIEIKQLAVRSKYGQLGTADLERIMGEFKHLMEKHLRVTGALSGK